LRPGSDLEPLIVNYLMDRRRGDGWGTTNETAHAVIALTDHLLGVGLGETAAVFTVALNGEPLTDPTLSGPPTAERNIEPGELRVVIEIPFDQLQPGRPNTIDLTAAHGRLYYALDERYRAARETIDADGPIVISRRYLSPRGDQDIEEIAPGDLVRVQITVRVPHDTFYVVIEDLVPAGLEPLNERLNTTSHQEPDYSDMDWQLYRWQSYGYNHKEIRDGRVSFFVTTLPIGVSRFEYMVRATHDGTFVALPAEAWAMYEPEVWGRSGSGELTIRN
jgi:uncharacterized protein YfaS (alpha-2-macroglobulin family)